MIKKLYCVIISIHTTVVLTGSIVIHICNGCNIGMYDLSYDFWFALAPKIFILGLITWALIHATGVLLSRSLSFSIVKALAFHVIMFIGTILLYAAPILVWERNWYPC